MRKHFQRKPFKVCNFKSFTYPSSLLPVTQTVLIISPGELVPEATVSVLNLVGYKGLGRLFLPAKWRTETATTGLFPSSLRVYSTGT
jgi:hypothetical protein